MAIAPAPTKPAAPTKPSSPILSPSATQATTVVPKGPAFLIRQVSTDSRWLKMLVYGGYGAGKTRLAGSAVLVPQMRDVLMIDAESGELTLATIKDAAWGDAVSSYIDSVRVTSFKELARVQEFLKAHCTFRDLPPEEGNPKLKALEERLMGDQYDPDKPARRYYTCMIDSLTEVETYSMYQLLGITDKTRLDEEAMESGWPEFRKNQTQILRTIRAFRDLPMNILMTAASDYSQDEQKRFAHKPALTGKLAKQCQGFMDIVGFLAIVQGADGSEVRRMMVKPSPRWDAKCRFSSFKDAYYEDPTMKSILQSVGLLDVPKK